MNPSGCRGSVCLVFNQLLEGGEGWDCVSHLPWWSAAQKVAPLLCSRSGGYEALVTMC